MPVYQFNMLKYLKKYKMKENAAENGAKVLEEWNSTDGVGGKVVELSRDEVETRPLNTEAQCQKITNTARGLQDGKLWTAGHFDYPCVVPPVELWQVSKNRTMSQKAEMSDGDVCQAIDVDQEEDVDQDMLYEEEGGA